MKSDEFVDHHKIPTATLGPQSSQLQIRMPKPLIARLLVFLQSNLTGQVVLDIRDGEIKSAKITEAVRMKISPEEET